MEGHPSWARNHVAHDAPMATPEIRVTILSANVRMTSERRLRPLTKMSHDDRSTSCQGMISDIVVMATSGQEEEAG